MGGLRVVENGGVAEGRAREIVQRGAKARTVPCLTDLVLMHAAALEGWLVLNCRLSAPVHQTD